MPLSEDEERILSEIESRLRESDPDLAHQVSSTTVYSDAFKKLRWAVMGFVVALVASVMALSVSYVLAFVGFLGMFAAALFIERNLRRVGRVGLREATQAVKRNSISDYLGTATDRARERLRRDDPDED